MSAAYRLHACHRIVRRSGAKFWCKERSRRPRFEPRLVGSDWEPARNRTVCRRGGGAPDGSRARGGRLAVHRVGPGSGAIQAKAVKLSLFVASPFPPLSLQENALSRSELERHLRKHEAKLVRHGGNHDIWESHDGEKESQVPRHWTIKKNTARRICDDLGVPRHASL